MKKSGAPARRRRKKNSCSGVIGDAVSDENGNIYLLDTQQQLVFKFSPSGEYLGLVSRKGEGPGEIDRVYNLHSPGNGRLAMSKSFPARIIMVDTLGIPLTDLSLVTETDEDKEGGFAMVFRIRFKEDHLVGQGQVMYGGGMKQDNLTYIARFDPEGAEEFRYDQWESGYDFTRPIKVDEVAEYHGFSTWDMDHEGRVYHTVARDSYVVEVVAPDGTLLRRIRREWSPRRRSAEEKEEVKDGYSFSSTEELPPISYEIGEDDPAIGRLKIIGEELWITSPEKDRQPRDGTAGHVSVFDLDGHLLEEREFVLPVNHEEDMVRHLADGRIVRVKAYRSASAAANNQLAVQRGEHLITGEEHDDEEILEVIVYQPVSR